jgi:hypothetical protein
LRIVPKGHIGLYGTKDERKLNMKRLLLAIAVVAMFALPALPASAYILVQWSGDPQPCCEIPVKMEIMNYVLVDCPDQIVVTSPGVGRDYSGSAPLMVMTNFHILLTAQITGTTSPSLGTWETALDGQPWQIELTTPHTVWANAGTWQNVAVWAGINNPNFGLLSPGFQTVANIVVTIEQAP